MKYLTILIALLLLVTAFGDLHVHYSFYQILKWLVTTSAILAAIYNKDKNTSLFVSFCVIAVIFNPIIPIYFGKVNWKVVDGISGVIFAIGAIKEYEKTT